MFNFVVEPWTRERVAALFDLPFTELVFEAARVHRQNHDPAVIEKAQLLSIKTGGCPEDCGYCAQSAHFDTGVKATKLMAVDAVLQDAARAKAAGATRYCMGAAWRSPKDRDLDAVCAMVEGVKALGLETCVTLGMLDAGQSARLKSAGLDFYNHNLDSSEAYYQTVTSTRTYKDRLDTLSAVRDAGIKVCCGGILGMGEAESDRVDLLLTLANLPAHPESVPINHLVGIKGTPLGGSEPLDAIELARAVAVARIVMPRSVVRLSAGREQLSDEAQALCFLAGANSIFFGDRLLTTSNPQAEHDRALFARLKVTPAAVNA